jgi:hypothetical protein
MELYSGDTLSREALVRPFTRLFPAAGTFIVRPAWGLWSLAVPSGEARAELLSRMARRRVSTPCALDTHGWPGYEAAFRALSLHLESVSTLSDDPVAAARQVTGAIREGSFHCSFGDWASTDGFALRGELDAQRVAAVGSVLELVLPAVPPGKVRVEVFGGGRLEEGNRVLLERPGLLWVEIRVQPAGGLPAMKWRPWIVSSPIWVRAGKEMP